MTNLIYFALICFFLVRFIYIKPFWNIIEILNNISNNIPKPSKDSIVLHCGLDIISIISEVNTLLPQITGFITQFNDLVANSGINVVTDSGGNMEIDVPQNMSDSDAENISKKIGIIDRLITHHGQKINDLLQKGICLENNLKANNPDYVPQLTTQIDKFKELNASYKH